MEIGDEEQRERIPNPLAWPTKSTLPSDTTIGNVVVHLVELLMTQLARMPATLIMQPQGVLSMETFMSLTVPLAPY